MQGPQSQTAGIQTIGPLIPIYVALEMWWDPTETSSFIMWKWNNNTAEAMKALIKPGMEDELQNWIPGLESSKLLDLSCPLLTSSFWPAFLPAQSSHPVGMSATTCHIQAGDKGEVFGKRRMNLQNIGLANILLSFFCNL